jgi:hypothetical protein
MTWTKRLALFLVFITSVGGYAGGCPKDDPTRPVAYFTLTVRNGTADSLDFFRTDYPAGFHVAGTVAPDSAMSVEGLEAHTAYLFRLSKSGSGPDAYLFQKTIVSEGGDLTWSVP